MKEQPKRGLPLQWTIICNKKKWNTDSGYNMAETWEHPKWKKPITKDRTLYDSIYT